VRISKTHWNRFRFRGFNFVFVSSRGSDQWPTYLRTLFDSSNINKKWDSFALSSFFPCLCALYMLRKGTQVSQAEKKAATSAPKTHRSRATTTRPAANCPKERCLSSFTCVLPNCFCSFAVNKDQNNLHNHHPFSCRELAAALTRTPPAAKIKLTAVHMVWLATWRQGDAWEIPTTSYLPRWCPRGKRAW